MKNKTVYKELTRDDAIELLRENNWRPVSGIVVRDDPSEKWQEPRELHGLIAGDSPFRTNLACWNHAALPIEEIEWEEGDTVEVVNDNEAPHFRAGAKGIVVSVAMKNRPKVKQVSPNPEAHGVWCVYATDLRPWKPGYGYLPNGERVPEPPEGYELCPEGEAIGEWALFYFLDDGWLPTALNPSSNAVSSPEVRAHARLKTPKLVPFDGPEDCQMRDTQTANAHLIAAAPDLLEALNATQRCLGFLKSIAQGGEDWTAQAQQEYDKACAIIDAAIAKTKGGAK